MRIVFMGTPEFAVPSMEILFEHGHEIVGVITAPDKPAGRGLKMSMSAVKEAALRYNVPILQPEKFKNPEFIEELRALKADLQVVVAFRMLPEIVWAMPTIGTFNLHASLLPQYRGAAPINWAIIRGEKKTGVTTFFLKHEIDTGDVIMMEEEPIFEEDNAETLYNRLKEKGANLVLKTVELIAKGNYTLSPQNTNQELYHAPKIFTETCQINFDQPTQVVYDFIRGLSPYPAAFMIHQEKRFKIYKTRKLYDSQPDGEVGSTHTNHKNYLWVKTQDGCISIEEIQAEGKKRMGIEEFLRGYRWNG